MFMNYLYISDFYEMKYEHHAVGDCCIFMNPIRSILTKRQRRLCHSVQDTEVLRGDGSIIKFLLVISQLKDLATARNLCLGLVLTAGRQA
jgi:hypothetical protein